ncbi:MAG: leucyl aminopeptidase [Pseudomonadota bacterium]
MNDDRAAPAAREPAAEPQCHGRLSAQDIPELVCSGTQAPAGSVPVDALILPAGLRDGLYDVTAAVDARLGGLIADLVRRGTVTGALGEIVAIPAGSGIQARYVLIAGLGGERALSRSDYRELVDRVFAALMPLGVASAAAYIADAAVDDGDAERNLLDLAHAAEVHGYRFPHSRPASAPPLAELVIGAGCADRRSLAHANATTKAVRLTRVLADSPANICTPSSLARAGVEISRAYGALEATVFDEAGIAGLGMECLLSVGRGSAEESRLLELRYRGGARGQAPIVLIGKGVTFDTGGTAIKSRESMRLMKYDMCGAAAVIGVMAAVAELALPLNIVALAACAENMPGGRASRPADVVTAMSGQQVEILNPDAEGRLLLCDCLTYSRRYDPAAVIDVATLTGASYVALGRHYSALLANDEALAGELLAAGERCGDRAWRLPLTPQDETQLDTDYADIANVGDGSAGCIVAGLFLARFAQHLRWVHLDVSGTAKRRGDRPAATGRPARLLLEFLIARAA